MGDGSSRKLSGVEFTIDFAVRSGAFHADTHRMFDLSSNLIAVATKADDADVRASLTLLGRIAGYWLSAENWLSPYAPAVVIGGMRSEIPSDLSESEVSFLAEIVASVPHDLLRARIYDLLFLRAEDSERVRYAISHIECVLQAQIETGTWSTEMEAWDRAATVARRLGTPTASLLPLIEDRLLAAILQESPDFLALRAAEMLQRHKLGKSSASKVARRLATIADADRDQARSRGYRDGASAWFLAGGDRTSASEQAVLVIESLVDEGDEVLNASSANEVGQAAHYFELALQKVRVLSRQARASAGIADLPTTLARRIRELGVVQVGQMREFRSASIDLSEAAEGAAKFVANRTAPEALARFVSLASFASFSGDMEAAKKSISDFPLSSMFQVRRLAADGRTVYRAPGKGGKAIYGVDPAVWRQMMKAYTIRLGLFVRGSLWPAFEQVSSEHHLSLEDFASFASLAPIIPSDRTRQYARALHYGFLGDFSTSMQLLAPQFENLVRVHLGNAGIPTSTVEGGVESEISINRLLEREQVEEILGEDLCYEMRALLCGQLGLNIRNEVAHGLISDAEAATANAVYLWWIGLRLVYVPFWNSLHDAESAQGRQPPERTSDVGE